MRAKPSYAEHAKGRKEPTSSRANPIQWSTCTPKQPFTLRHLTGSVPPADRQLRPLAQVLERVGLASIPKALPERPVDEPTIAVHGPLHAAREQRVIVMLWYKSSFVVEGSASKAEGPFGHDGISVDVVRRSLEHEDRRHISDHVMHCMLDVGQCLEEALPGPLA